MATIDDQMTEIYVFVDDYLKAHTSLANWRRSANDEPSFSDAEVLTIGLMQSCFNVAKLKEVYEKIRDNYLAAFPQLCSYQRWIARLHQLSELIGELFIATRCLDNKQLYLTDSKPIPVCHPIRHGRVRLLREDGSYFGKTSKGWFFGFKLHMLRSIDGLIINAILTPGNWVDQDVILALGLSVDGGIILGDLGYKGRDIAQLMADDAEILLLTRAETPNHKALISCVRQAIETTFGQLWNDFIDRVFSRSWQGLWNTIKLKLLNFNLRHLRLLSV